MRRLLFVVFGLSGLGGMERALNLVASSLSSTFKLEVLALEAEGRCSFQYPETVRLIWAGAAGGLLHGNLLVARMIRRRSPDIVIQVGAGELRYLLLARLLFRFRLVVWEHFNAAIFYRRPSRRLAAIMANLIVALTERDAEDWRRFLRPRCPVLAIPNPVPELPAVPAALEAKRILAAGRLDGQKHFDLLIEAFALAAPTLPGWSLRIRGAGGDEIALKDLAARLSLDDRVEILPPTGDMAGEYREASIFALSSRFEGFPMVLLEAKAAGLPCVSVDCPNGPRELIRDGVDGYLVPIDDAQAMALAIQRMAVDSETRKAMGSAARVSVAQYMQAAIARRWEDALRPAKRKANDEQGR